MPTLALFAALTLALDDPAAQPSPPEPSEPPPALELERRPSEELHVAIEPGVWFARLRGDTTFTPSGAGTLDLDLDLGLASQDAAFRGEAQVSWDEWIVRADGSSYSADATQTLDQGGTFGAVTVPVDGDVRSTFELDSIGAEASWALARPVSDYHWGWSDRAYNAGNVNSNGDYLAELRLGLAAGFRYYGVEQSFERLSAGTGPSTQRVDAEWIAIMGGADITFTLRPGDKFPLVDTFSLFGAGMIGPALGGDNGIAFQIRAGVTARVTPNIGFTFGWRAIEIDADDGDYSLDGRLQGIFAAASIAF